MDKGNPYSIVVDRHKARAHIYYKDSQEHEVHYEDNEGHEFYVEFFYHVPIEMVEQSVEDWATGKRELI